MKGKSFIQRLLCLFVLLVALTGCNQVTTGERIDVSETDGTKVDVSETDETKADSSETDAVQEDEKKNALYDRAAVDGKMAVYFFESDTVWSGWSGAIHSGDCVLIIAPDGKTMLIDSNTPESGASIVNSLQQLGVEKIDYLVISHPHIDHVGGCAYLWRYIEIGELITSPAYYTATGSLNITYWNNILSQAEEHGVKHTCLVEGDSFDFGGINVKIYNPPADFDYEAGIDFNECSLVMKMQYGDSSFLFGGDTGVREEYATETMLCEKYGSELQADIAKANHHMKGTTGAMSDIWLETVQAKAYIGQLESVYEQTYWQTWKSGAAVLHTALDGTIRVTTSGNGTYDIRVEKERQNDYYGLLDTKDNCMKIE